MQDEIYGSLGPDDPREIGGYRIVARLGAGGMGQVFLGTTQSGRRLAVKVVRPDFADDPAFRRRFEQEVAAAQRVQSLYTAAVIDADPTGPTPWLATVHVPGPSLAQAVMDEGPLPVGSVRALAAGVAEALQSIHKAGVIHRDLKPSNVILAADGPRVIDFGIARAADATPLTRTGGTVGSPQFMAPEQVDGTPSTPALDVFAFGSLVFFAATGRSPFGEGVPQAVMYRIANAEPVLDGCPPELADLVARCLAKRPEDRPAVSDLLDELTDTPRDGWLPEAVATRVMGYDQIPTAEDVPPPNPPTIPDPVQPYPGPTHVQPQPAHPDPTQVQPQPGPHMPFPATHPGPHTPFPPTHPGPQPPHPQPGPVPGPPPKRRRTGLILTGALVAVLLVAGAASAITLKVAAGGGEQGGAGQPTQAAPQQSQPAPSAPAQVPSGGVTDAAPTDGSTPAGGVQPGTQPLGAVLGTYKDIKLAAGYRINFTEDPEHPRRDGLYDLSYSGYRMSAAQIAVMQPGEPGTYEACRDNTGYTRSLRDDIIRKGLVFCVTSSRGIVGLVTVTGRESSPSDYVSLDLTLWQGAIPQPN